jgi:hypothetical protein
MDGQPNPSQRFPLEILRKLKPFCSRLGLLRHRRRDRLSALTIAGQKRAPCAFPTQCARKATPVVRMDDRLSLADHRHRLGRPTADVMDARHRQMRHSLKV